MRALGRRLADRLLDGLGPPGSIPERRAPGAVMLEARDVRVDFGSVPVLRGVGLVARAGEVVALIGPNGAGKSTLLSVLTGDLRPASGQVEVDGRPMDAWAPRELGRRRAVLPQQVTMTFPFTSEDVVRMGRSPWAGTPAEDDDDRIVAAALASADVAHLVDRPFPSLSGGERARVALARVLAQRTQILLLDEPTAALDLHHQEEVLALLRRLAADGCAVVVVVHDLGLAAGYADRIVVLADGVVVADGSPAEVCTADQLSRVYQHPLEVLDHPRTGVPLVLPVRDPSDPADP